MDYLIECEFLRGYSCSFIINTSRYCVGLPGLGYATEMSHHKSVTATNGLELVLNQPFQMNEQYLELHNPYPINLYLLFQHYS